MTHWRVIPALRRTTVCPVALDLRDEFTGAGAFGRITLRLDLKSGANWIETDIEPSRNPGGTFLFTGLGRAIDPVAFPTFRVRVRIEAEFYSPAFRTTDDAIEFDVATYNDTVPPAVPLPAAAVVLMLPAANYPYGGHLRRLHGRVLDPGGQPLADALVEADTVERVITGPGGAFTLPLRWQIATASVNVTADHARSGRSAAQTFTLPGDLTGNHDLTVT